ESARGRRQSLSLRERAVERAQPLLVQCDLLRERRTLPAHALVEHAARLLELGAQPAKQRLCRLAAHRDALCGTAQAVQLLHHELARARCVRELLLRLPALGEDRLQPLVGAALRERGCGTPLACSRETVVERREIELGDARAQLRQLSAQPLGALRRRRLERQRTQALLHLGLEIARALDLDGDPRQLELGAMAPGLEAPEAGRLLDERAPLLGT